MTAKSLREIAERLRALADSLGAEVADGCPQLTLSLDDPESDRIRSVRIELTWQARPAEKRPSRSAPKALTTRESEVARLLALRLSNREIANRLVISEHTARHHVERVMSKLGVDSRRMIG